MERKDSSITGEPIKLHSGREACIWVVARTEEKSNLSGLLKGSFSLSLALSFVF